MVKLFNARDYLRWRRTDMPHKRPEVTLAKLVQVDVIGAAPRSLGAQRLDLDAIVKVLQRDDPTRRSYLQRRWYSGGEWQVRHKMHAVINRRGMR
jgi:hypothetical protein